MCAVILFPYYKKDVSKELAAAKAELNKKQNELEVDTVQLQKVEEVVRRQEDEVRQVRDAQAALLICKDGLNQCQVALGKNFLVVEVVWTSKANVDLHVTDALGNEFYWRHTNKCECDFRDTRARLSVDSYGGPGGLEVWIDPEVRAGTYRIEYVLEQAPTEDVTVVGTVIDRKGARLLGQKSFSSNVHDQRLLGAEVQISSDGEMTIR
jgi:hypothetical protein